MLESFLQIKQYLPENLWKTIGLIMIGVHTGHWIFWATQKRKEKLESLSKLVGTHEDTISANRLHCENQHKEVMKSIDKLTESNNKLAEQMMKMFDMFSSHIYPYTPKRKTDFSQEQLVHE